MKLGRGVFAVATALVALQGCGGNGDGTSGDGKSAPEAETMTVAGSLLLVNGGGFDKGEPCFIPAGYEDVREGAPVVVYNSKGAKIALGQLGSGVTSNYDDFDDDWDCLFEFNIGEVPVDGPVYAIEVSKRGQVDFKRDDSERLSLTLGRDD